MKTIGKIIHHKTFNLIIRDFNDNPLYVERPSGFWIKRKYDKKGNRIYFESSGGTVADDRL